MAADFEKIKNDLIKTYYKIRAVFIVFRQLD